MHSYSYSNSYFSSHFNFNFFTHSKLYDQSTPIFILPFIIRDLMLIGTKMMETHQ